jgi:hypothetical protein
VLLVRRGSGQERKEGQAKVVNKHAVCVEGSTHWVTAVDDEMLTDTRHVIHKHNYKFRHTQT